MEGEIREQTWRGHLMTAGTKTAPDPAAHCTPCSPRDEVTDPPRLASAVQHPQIG